jgi:membrane protein YqaA with SNARE-associated domain
MIEYIIDSFFSFLGQTGYLGIFLISFVGSIIIFVPPVYYSLLITAVLDKDLDPHLIAFISAVGIVAAKVIIFRVSYFGHKFLERDNIKRSKIMHNIHKFVIKYGWGAAFVVAATPIPDDVVYITLGFSKYSIWKFVVATFVGKFLINELLIVGVITFGKPYMEHFLSNTVDHQFQLMIGIVIAITTVLSITILMPTKIGSGRFIVKHFSFKSHLLIKEGPLNDFRKKIRDSKKYLKNLF